MARGHGRILTSIWEDEDFKALDPAEQRLYLFLISQPNLNHAGLLDLTLRRWARKARGLTVAELEKTIAALEAARFIVVDDDTEELLIRSFIRNDGVWRMPKVMGAMVSGALEITSKRLQQALLAEMDRIPLDELNNEPTKLRNGESGPSIRRQVSDCIDTLRRAFRKPNPDPSRGGSGTPSATPSGTPSDTPAEGDAEGGPRPSTRGHAGPHMHAAPAPAPAPFPYPSPVREDAGAGSELEQAAASTGGWPDGPPAPIDVDGFSLTDTMRKWARDAYSKIDVDYETDQFVDHFRADGGRRHNWYAEWQKWIRRANKWAGEKQQRSGSNVYQLPTGQTLTGPDARFAAHAALTAQLRAEEARESS